MWERTGMPARSKAALCSGSNLHGGGHTVLGLASRSADMVAAQCARAHAGVDGKVGGSG